MSEDLQTLRERVKWRSRRGLLELDLFFVRFYKEHLDSLSRAQLEDLLSFLKEVEDIELWGMVGGNNPCEVERYKPIVALLKSSAPIIEGEIT